MLRVHSDFCNTQCLVCGDFTMDPQTEQRVCIKFCANLGKSATETLIMIQKLSHWKSVSRELCTKNSSYPTKQQILHTTVTFAKAPWRRVAMTAQSLASRELAAAAQCALSHILAHRELFGKKPYTPDLAPCNFALFPKLKLVLKGHQFATLDRIQEALLVVLNTLKQQDFRTHLTSVRSTGTGVYKQMETTLRVMLTISPKVVSTNGSTIPENFE